MKDVFKKYSLDENIASFTGHAIACYRNDAYVCTCVCVCMHLCVCTRVCAFVCVHACVFGHLSDSFILYNTWELLCNYHIPMDEHSYLFTSGYAKVVLSLLCASKDITLYLKQRLFTEQHITAVNYLHCEQTNNTAADAEPLTCLLL